MGAQITKPSESIALPKALKTCGILGGGSFGTALAAVFSRLNQDVTIYVRNKENAAYINKNHQNPKYVKGFDIPKEVVASSDLLGTIKDKDWIVLAVPSQVLRRVLKDIKEAWEKRPVPLLLACKGVETDTLYTMDEVVIDVLGKQARQWVMALSGPSFAKEMMQGMITAVTIAGRNKKLCKMVCKALFSQKFRPYYSTDMIGVEIGGALKNVVAIAAGICIGMEMGVNARTLLITRGLHEITQIAIVKGANPMTLAGLSGIGDLMLTCGSTLSRNNRVGQALGKGKTVEQACEEIGEVAEGIITTKSAFLLMQKLKLDLPIITGVYSILYHNKKPADVLAKLMAIPSGKEMSYKFNEDSDLGIHKLHQLQLQAQPSGANLMSPGAIEKYMLTPGTESGTPAALRDDPSELKIEEAAKKADGGDDLKLDD